MGEKKYLSTITLLFCAQLAKKKLKVWGAHAERLQTEVPTARPARQRGRSSFMAIQRYDKMEVCIVEFPLIRTIQKGDDVAVSNLCKWAAENCCEKNALEPKERNAFW